MRKINQDIQNHTFEHLYLLYGEEGYLRKQYRDRLRQGICGEDMMNYSYYEGKGKSAEEIIATADTMPFFAEQRLVVVENSGCFKTANEKLLEYLSHIPETSILVFVEEEVDKRGKMFKRAKEVGYVCELAEQTPATLGKWVSSMVISQGKQMDRNAIDYFLAVTGTDMNMIRSELDKLISYVGSREVISRDDIDEICSVMTVSKIFDMVDAMGNKDRKKTLTLYYDMIEVREPPMRILYMLARQFRIMLEGGELQKNGLNAKEIAGKLALAPFVVNKALKQAEKFKTKDLKSALNECLQIETDVKNGRLEDKIGVEMILLKYGSS